MADDLTRVRAHEPQLLLDRIEERLSHEPTRQTWNRKLLISLVPPLKTVAIEEATSDAWIEDAQGERVVITRNGQPVALVVGIEGMDLEQIELGSSDAFWTLITKRRAQKPISRAELEERL